MSVSCPLCKGKSTNFYQDSKHSFRLCSVCQGIFRNEKQFLSLKEEKKRYMNHINSEDDQGYYNFISPIIDEVRTHFSKDSIGLDFGCGHTPVLSRHLLKEGFQVLEFDPVFFNDATVLEKDFDFIVSCEVIEHFYNPIKEFKQLFQRLNAHGKLICKTHPYNSTIDFDSWYYKNDPTHVFIYQNETFEWIRNAFTLRNVKINDRLITFSK